MTCGASPSITAETPRPPNDSLYSLQPMTPSSVLILRKSKLRGPASACKCSSFVIFMARPLHLVGQRAVDLDLGRAGYEPFLLTALAVGSQVRRLAMGVEGRVVLVLLVEDEEVGIFRGAMRAIDEAARLRLPDRGYLLTEQRRQHVALALRRPDLRHDRQHVSHLSFSFACERHCA